ncbi:MAG: translocation/assembly module TamB domain-containing protein, partial [Steroidobacteraceae bacterium]
WSPRTSWSASGSATGVDPASLRPDLPGRLTFDFEVAGAHFDAGTSFSVTLHHLSGRVRGLETRAAGTVARRGAVWTLEDVTGRLGPTTFSLAGRLSDTLDLRFKLAAQDLALFDPRLAGHLLASGSVTGPRRSPAIDAVASGGAIHGRGLSVGSFDARIDFDPRRSGPSHIHIRAHDLAYRRHRLNVAFALDGPAAHQIGTLSLSGLAYRMSSSAVGALAGGVWAGRIERLDFAGGDVRLALVSPGVLDASTRAIHLGQICVRGRPARMCAALDWAPGDWSMSALAQDLPLGLLTGGVSPNVHFRGTVGATVHLSASGLRPARGELSVTIARAEMVRRRPDGSRETTQLGSSTLTVNATPDRLEGAVKLDAGAVGSIAGRIEARRAATGWRGSPLTGTITARTTLGAWAPLYAGLIDQASGEASVRLAVAGTLGTPQLSGTLGVTNGALDLYRYNLEVHGASIQARLAANGLDFRGAAHLGAGTASAQGHLEWRSGAPFGDVKLSGTSLRVVDLPEAVVDASPDLDFHIAGRQAHVTGVVKIPYARLAPAGLTNAVHVSPDEIIVGEDTASPTGKLDVTSAIGIELGDHVDIDTQGLTGRLTGQVNVASGADSITRASGELRIVGGRYAAYGRTLEIARGRLIYTSSPIDDPGIDIRAQKNFQDPDIGAAVAGIDVRGTLLNPRITFFSEPPLPQAQIVSLVLAGGTLLGGPQLGVAATAPTSRSVNAQLLGQGAAVLGSQMGLPLAIEPMYNNDTALVLGKYLSPRLYVSYGITLVQSLNIVKLRYTLGDHWSVSTEVGQLGGADLVYSFEK